MCSVSTFPTATSFYEFFIIAISIFGSILMFESFLFMSGQLHERRSHGCFHFRHFLCSNVSNNFSFHLFLAFQRYLAICFETPDLQLLFANQHSIIIYLANSSIFTHSFWRGSVCPQLHYFLVLYYFGFHQFSLLN